MKYLDINTVIGKNPDGTLITEVVTEPVYNVNDFPYRKFVTSQLVRKKDKVYYNIPCTFDIESSTLEPPKRKIHRRNGKIDEEYEFTPYGFMYQWQFCICDCVVFGRRWEEFQTLLSNLQRELRLYNGKKLIIYVHFLAYEFQFIKDFLDIESIFAKEKRKPMKIETSSFEFRCSYFLSNMSLSKFCENTKGCRYWKKKDTYNYKLLRTPDTYLTKTELEYCYCDVRGLSECIQALLLEDDVTTIPLTSTGYVRRDCRNAMNTKEWRQTFKKCELNTKQYKLLREIFRGGDTHANRKYAGKIIENVRSKDIESSYPARCMLSYFPCGKLTKVSINTIEEYEKYSSKYCVMFRANFWGLKIHEDEPFPYIPIAKTLYRSNVVNDNGRILKASYIQISLTEIDMQIIQEQYDMDGFTIEEAYISTRGQLPIELMQVIIDYYNSKTSLKGIADCYYEYMKKKNKLNSTYGMMVSAIVHNIITYECGKWDSDSEDCEKALKKYFSGRNNFLLYQHGVYVTAHARKDLREGVKLVKDCAVYQDTDSVKFFKYPMSIFDKLNEEKEKEAENNIVPAIAYDKDKRLHHMGIWDDDGEYPLFKTLGAKKYAYTDKDGEFHITVSGMSKKLGAKAIKKIENFEITGVPLKDIGRTTSWYNEKNIHEISITDYRDKESTFTTASNIAVLDSTYEIGITGEYAEVLKKYVDVSCIV